MRLDIIIPARAEQAGIAATLAAVLADGDGLDLLVLLCLNGEGMAETRAAAQPFAPAFAARGHVLGIIEVAGSGKAAALNAGDAARPADRRDAPLVYLDADARPRPGTLRALVAALATPEPRLAGPRRALSAHGRLAHSFGLVWEALPGMAGFIGGGCYAVNAAGRALWGAFPDLVADDGFVFSRFAAEQRVIPNGAVIGFALPAGAALPRMVRRWREGNAALASHRHGPRPGLSWLLRHPRLIPHLPAFLLTHVAARLIASPLRGTGWRPWRA